MAVLLADIQTFPLVPCYRCIIIRSVSLLQRWSEQYQATQHILSQHIHSRIQRTQTLVQGTRFLLQNMDPLAIRWDPSRTLANIDNRSCNIRCVGYARTANRRCRNLIATENQAKAAIIVTEMSRLDISSPEVTCLLKRLAPLVLCRRWHQDQAVDVVDDWRDEVAALRREREAARREEEERLQDSPLRSAEERRVRGAVQGAEESRHQQEAAQQPNEVQQAQEVAPRAEEASYEQEAVNRIEIQQLRAQLALMCARLEELEEKNRELQHTTRSARPERHSSIVVDQDAAPEGGVPATMPISPTSTSDQHVAEEPVIPIPSPVESEEEEPTPPTITSRNHLPEEPEALDNRATEESCSICLESLGHQNDLTRCVAQCGQLFHKDCVGIWLVSGENTRTCPYW